MDQFNLSDDDAPYFEQERALYQAVTAQRFYIYYRLRIGHRILELLPDYTIGQGSAGMEQYWSFCVDTGTLNLIIAGRSGITCKLQFSDGLWQGKWERFECNPVILLPLDRL